MVESQKSKLCETVRFNSFCYCGRASGISASAEEGHQCSVHSIAFEKMRNLLWVVIVMSGSWICIEGLSPPTINAVGSSAHIDGRLRISSPMRRMSRRAPLNQQGSDIEPNEPARRRGERRRRAERGFLPLLLTATVVPSLLFAPGPAEAAPFQEVAPNYSSSFRRLSETESFKSLRREPVLARAVKEVRDLQELQDSRLEKCADRYVDSANLGIFANFVVRPYIPSWSDPKRGVLGAVLYVWRE